MLLSQALSRGQLARLSSASSKTVRRYIKQHKRGGIEALKRRRYRDQQSEVDEHAETLKDNIDKSCAFRKLGPPLLIGIRRQQSQLRGFLKRLRARYRKAGTVPGKSNEEKWEEQRELLEKGLNPRLNEAANPALAGWLGKLPSRCPGLLPAAGANSSGLQTAPCRRPIPDDCRFIPPRPIIRITSEPVAARAACR
ncbi:MAG TPA: hypothetical protein EYP14_13030 [Planctomycetaceae bacterium]|nr:hypothetical protein [Planctomycetaceae bacterium]